MNHPRERYYKGIFAVAAVYDIVLGIIFLFFGRWSFEVLDIADKYPEGGFLPLIGAFMLVLGVGYYLIWRGDLRRNRDLVAIGTLYKLAYTGVGLYIAVTDAVPHVLFLWGFGVADAVFFLLMAECLVYLFRQRTDSANVEAVPVGR